MKKIEQRVKAITEVFVNFAKGYYKKVSPGSKIDENKVVVLKKQLHEYFMHELQQKLKVFATTSFRTDDEVFYGIKNAIEESGMPKNFFPKSFLLEFNKNEMVLSYFDKKSELIYDLLFADFNEEEGNMVKTTNFLNAEGSIIEALSNYAYVRYHFAEVESAFEN